MWILQVGILHRQRRIGRQAAAGVGVAQGQEVMPIGRLL
jgi:hypothetical protein